MRKCIVLHNAFITLDIRMCLSSGILCISRNAGSETEAARQLRCSAGVSAKILLLQPVLQEQGHSFRDG